jgi:ABC-2 type transport system permease protein
VVARKEFTDHLLSVRFFILVGIMGLLLVIAVYAASGGIRSVAGRSSDFPALFLKLFTVAPERIPPFFTLVGLLGPLLGIAFGFDAVNGERTQGTLPRLLAQPIYRDDVINGKFVAGISTIGLTLGCLMLLMTGIGMLRIGVVPTVGEVIRLLLYLLVTVIYIGFWLALASLFSVVLRNAATSALASIGAWLVTILYAIFLVGFVADVLAPVPDNPTVGEAVRNARYERNLARLYPGTLYQEVTVVLLTPEQQTLDPLGSLLLQAEPRAIPSELSLDQSLLVVWPQVTLLVALTAACFAAAYVAFMRQEVRA